jgi:hypothetical protein
MSASSRLNVATLSPSPIRAWLPAILAFLGVLGLIFVGQNIDQWNFVTLSDQPQINRWFSYQFITIGMTLIYLVIVYALRPDSFKQFARLGQLNAPASPIRWLGVGANETWRGVGMNFALVITIVTGIFLYFNFIQPNGTPLEKLLAALPIAVILAAMNAFVEEALTRFGVVVGLYGVIPNRMIYLVSALIFGIPHYFGVPGGFLGAAMSAFLGWLMARSVIETRGVFWAWFIHFLQDIVIFATLLSAIGGAA